MNPDKNILLLTQAEAEADLMITQLMQFKDRVHKLRKTMAGVSTPALEKGDNSIDAAVTAVLNNRDRTIRRRMERKK